MATCGDAGTVRYSSFAKESRTLMLTLFAIERAKPRDKLYKLSDGLGLFLHIQPNGRKQWRFRYRFNDLLRTEFTGRVALMTPNVWMLPPELRGRALYRMTRYNTFSHDSDHGEGVFVFAGYSFVWRMESFGGERSISLMMKRTSKKEAAFLSRLQYLV